MDCLYSFLRVFYAESAACWRGFAFVVIIKIVLLVIIYIAFISLGLPDSLLGSGWPVMHGAFGVPAHYAGFISIIITGGTVISSLVSTKAIARFGTSKVVAVSVMLTAIALLGFSFSKQFVFLLILAFPLGLGAGSIDAALNNFVALNYKARHMNFLHGCWGVGASFSPIIMFFWLSRNSAWQSGYLTVGIIQLCIAALMFFSFPLWKKIENQKTFDQEKDGDGGAKTEAPGIIETIGIPGVKAAVLSFFAYCAFETTVGLWGPTFLVVIKGLPPENAAQWISSYYMGITAGRFLSGIISHFFSANTMIKAGSAVIFLSCIIMNIPFGNFYLAGFIILGLGCAPVFPSLIHLTPAHFGQKHSQAVVGLQMAGAYLGATTMPALAGKLASIFSFNCFTVFIVFFFFVMTAAVFYLKKCVKKRM